MRHRRASVSNGVLRPRRVRVSREMLVLVGLALVAIWIVWAFAQEVYLSHQLSRQAADLRRQNAAMQVANDGYRRDISAVSSGAAAEEEARLNGYARSDEKLYLISAPRPSPSAAPTGAASGRPQARAPAGPLQQAWAWLTHAGGSGE